MVGRRAFILGLTGALTAPAIVRVESLMKLWVPPAMDFSTDHLLIKSTERWAAGYFDERILNDPIFVRGMQSLANSMIDNVMERGHSAPGSGLSAFLDA